MVLPFSEHSTRTIAPAHAAPRCPLCRGAGAGLFAKRGHTIYRCVACEHRYAASLGTDHVARTYGDEYFSNAAGGYAGYDREAGALARRGRWYARQLATFGPPGRLLDVGAASGHVLGGFVAAGWSGCGLEPNDTYANAARARGLDVRTATIEDAVLEAPFDVVAFMQVLPHFVDVRAALRRAAAVTRPGGLWLVETWDRSSVVAHALGTRWHEYNPPSVLHWFSRASLRRLLADYGLHYVAGGRPPKGISGAHARSLLATDRATLAGRAIGLAARAIPANLYVPYPGDDVFWAAYRKDTN